MRPEKDDGFATWRLLSALPGVVFPALPARDAAEAPAVLDQLAASQWLPAEALREKQHLQLERVLAHAYETVPYYRARWGRPADVSRFAELPLLGKEDLRGRFEDLGSRAVPADHGAVHASSTSGSTGVPVRVQKTAFVDRLWNAFTLRDHLWHGRDLREKLFVVRNRTPGLAQAPERAQNWGPATAALCATGEALLLGTETELGALLGRIAEERPGYLLAYPLVVAELARLSLAKGERLQGLREVRTYGERLDPEVRELCRRAWGAKLTDHYSTVELGYLALQCPEHEHYHVQAEGVLLEVLDDAGKPCAPGVPGRVVVTSLHNFAMPLIRYELGDFAELGEPCPCGRGLPVLKRINGRTHATLVTRGGERYWPYFGWVGILDVAPLLQHQFIQKRYDLIEAHIVTAGRLPAEQEEALRRHLLERLPAGMRVELVYRERIEVPPGGKLQQFFSEVA